MNTAYLLIGGNLGNRSENLAKALDLISIYCGKINHYSSVYETAAWGNTEQPAFLNQVVEISTSLNARQLLRKVMKVEKLMGRERFEKMGPRTIDIDILFFGTEIHQLRFLKVPHPEMHKRRFTLVPLAEITPGFVHPQLHKTVQQLLEECPDTLTVKKFQC